MLLRRLCVSVICTLFIVCAAQGTLAQGTHNFRINIPQKTPNPSSPGPLPITTVKATVALSETIAVSGPVAFTFSDENGASKTITCSAASCTPSAAAACPTSPTEACFPLSASESGNGAEGQDRVKVVPVSGPTQDPVRYEMDLRLFSNFNINTGNNSCFNTQSANLNYYDVQISSAVDNKITGVCLESFDGLQRPQNTNGCTGQNWNRYEIPVPPTVTGDVVATVDPLPQPTSACYQDPKNPTRPYLDVILALDKSGSMSTVDPGYSTSRMDALHSAAGNLLSAWTGLTPSNDQTAIVSFSTTSNLDLGLSNVVTANVAGTVNGLSPGGSTSIGAGLLTALQNLGPSGRRKAILLMTDGQQNTDPKVEVTDLVTRRPEIYCDVASNCPTSPPPGLTCTYTSSDPCPLSAAPPQIYTVTMGPTSTLNPAIDQAIAHATLGFYLHENETSTPTDPALLKVFFIQLLQNFVRFSSYETVRLVSKNVTPTTPYSVALPISTTSHDAVFTLMWPSQLGALRLTITPPGGVRPIVQEGASGFLSLVEPLPLPAPFDPRGDWKVLVEALGTAGARLTTTIGGGSVPFNLHVMTDDAAIKTELSNVPGDYKPGDQIRLRAKLTQFGAPIPGVGSRPGDKIEVQLVRPGNSIGDVLSDSRASTTSSGPDQQTPVEARLANTLQNDPTILIRTSDTVQLFDDGKPEHGDDVAGDGIYNALYPAILPGHYNFLFSVESTDPNAVHFSRQQLRTAYVRAIPDSDNTVIQSSIVRRDKGGVLSIVMTPRVKPGPGCLKTNPKCGRMGPGWANYFWFTTPGQAPFKAVDNLNGTYTATLAFMGSNPPAVSVHFENALAVIGDSVTADHLPDPLGPNNTLVDDCCKQTGKFALFLDAGGNIPHGTFADVFDPGFSLNTGVEYLLTSHLSVEGMFGYHHLPGHVTPALNAYQFSANGKAYLTAWKFRPFVNGGVGGYKFSPGSTYFGGNVGAGVLYNFTSRFGLAGSYNYHVAKTPVEATKFSTLQGGVRFVF